MGKNIYKTILLSISAFLLFSCSFLSNDEGTLLINLEENVERLVSRAPDMDSKGNEYSITLTSKKGKVFFDSSTTDKDIKIDNIPVGEYTISIVNPDYKYDFVDKQKIKIVVGANNFTANLKPVRNQDIIFKNLNQGFKFDLPAVEEAGVLIECENLTNHSVTSLSKWDTNPQVLVNEYIDSNTPYDIKVSFLNQRRETVRSETFKNITAKGGIGELKSDLEPAAFYDDMTHSINFDPSPRRKSSQTNPDDWFISYDYNGKKAIEEPIPNSDVSRIDLKMIKIEDEEIIGKDLNNPHLILRFIADDGVIYEKVFNDNFNFPKTVVIPEVPKLSIESVSDGARLILSNVPVGTNKIRISKRKTNEPLAMYSIDLLNYIMPENPTNVEIFTDHFITPSTEYIYSAECIKVEQSEQNPREVSLAIIPDKTFTVVNGIGDLAFNNNQMANYDSLSRTTTFNPELDFTKFTSCYPDESFTVETSMSYKTPDNQYVHVFSYDDQSRIDFNGVDFRDVPLTLQQVNIKLESRSIRIISNFAADSANIQNISDIQTITVDSESAQPILLDVPQDISPAV